MASRGGVRRVAVVHGYYSSRVPSGENVVVDLQLAALREAGYDVEAFGIVQEDAERALAYPLRAALRVATGRGPAPMLEEFDPDVIHVHNLFPNFGRHWVAPFGSRLVATLHNFRPICPAATLFRDGGPCTECPDSGSALPAVRHGCYRSSKVASVPVALGTRMARDPVLQSAARLIVLSDLMREHYRAAGVDSERMVTVPNFVTDPTTELAQADERSYWLYVGRLSAEKGIARLVADWPDGHRLVVIGDGPLMPELQRSAGPGVELRGSMPRTEVQRMLAQAVGLVFPSLWPEGLPTVYLEALANGTPVLASPQSVVGTLVVTERTGALMTGDLRKDLDVAQSSFPSMRSTCRATFETKYSQASWLQAIGQLYEEVVADRGC